jgi:hypothetical protein
MTDHFDISARIDDRLLALGRTLVDPSLGQDIKLAELASAVDRINVLEEQRPMAELLSIVTDALAPQDAA